MRKIGPEVVLGHEWLKRQISGTNDPRRAPAVKGTRKPALQSPIQFRLLRGFLNNL
jgi:hypothetical protein